MTLFGWQGRLYVGYGDANANSRPDRGHLLGPRHRQGPAPHWVSQTEAIYSYRAIGERL